LLREELDDGEVVRDDAVDAVGGELVHAGGVVDDPGEDDEIPFAEQARGGRVKQFLAHAHAIDNPVRDRIEDESFQVDPAADA
jgi:hypothetical protein